MRIDKVTLEILKNHTRAAAEGMAYTLYRTAHSTFVKETEDFTTGLTTPSGETFATPTELGATWFVGLNYGRAIKKISNYNPGDICMTNDPYSGFVCTHPPDMHIWKPIFFNNEIVAYSVGHIHNTDVGGAVPASLSRTLTEVHQEGIRIPPAKIYDKGKLNDELLNIFLTNVRAPEQNWGDLKAQIAACNTGERKVLEMIDRFGLETFKNGVKDLLDYSEIQARSIISDLPDGEYDFSDFIDEDSVNGWPCRIRLKLIINKDNLILDFTGSDPQLESSLNMPTGGDERHVLMLVGVVYVLYSLDPSLYLNSGIARACKCILPSGTIVNPVFPAAVGMRTLSCNRMHGLTFGSFAKALPNKMMGAPGSGGPILNVNTTDTLTGRRIMAAINPMTGGAGGTKSADGSEGSGANAGFLKNTPVEVNEVEAGIRVHRYGLKLDSGGAGFNRGGLGTDFVFQALSPNTKITARNRDRTRFSGWGIEKGYPGGASIFIKNPGKENEFNLKNTDILTLDPNDIIHVSCGGGGGWGSPLERDPLKVLLDVQKGWVSVEGAKKDYGVIITKVNKSNNNFTQFDLNLVETKKLRTTLRNKLNRSKNNANFFRFCSSRIEYEKNWNYESYDVLTKYLAKLPVTWRFFVKQKIFSEIENLVLSNKNFNQPDTIKKIYYDIIEQFPEIKNSLNTVV